MSEWQPIKTAPLGRLLRLAKMVDGKVIEQEDGSMHHAGICYWGGRMLRRTDEHPTHWRPASGKSY